MRWSGFRVALAQKILNPSLPERRLTYRARILLLFCLTAGYILLFLLLKPTVGTSIAILVALPTALSGWMFGLYWGLFAWVLSIILNMLLLAITEAEISSSIGTRLLWILGYGIVLFFTGALGYIHELGKRLEAELARREAAETLERQRNSELEAVYHASLQLTSTLELQPVLTTVMQQVSRLLHTQEIHVFLYDGAELSFGAAQWQGEQRDTPFREPRQNGLTYFVARSGQRLVISDVDTHPLYQDMKWGGAIAAFPLHIGDTGLRGHEYRLFHTASLHRKRNPPGGIASRSGSTCHSQRP